MTTHDAPDRAAAAAAASTTVGIEAPAATTPLHLSSALPLDRDTSAAMPGPGWFVVVAVLLVLLVAIFLLRRLGIGGLGGAFSGITRERSIRLVESRSISRRGTLHVVEFGQRRILLAESAAGIEKITDEPLSERADG